ncbi:MAG: Ig-like domain-containing protein, partial [Chloroflexota bacterium]
MPGSHATQEIPLPNRVKVALIASLTIISSLMAAAPMGAAVTPQKVVIIVGPTGAQTDNYRSKGDAIAAVAVAAGATAVKVYSPNATWANVKAAVNGANIVVYLGHGNGFPNPYGSTELTDRHNGWGLNRTTTNGDGDNWGSTMVYCGEKVLRGMLTSSDDSARLTYCGGTANDGITPAPNWVMIFSNACYAPGASEGWDTPATESVAFQRVRNYSYPGLSIGGGAYFATDMQSGAPQLVDTILRNPGMAFGAIAENANGYDLYRQRHFAHPDLAGTRIWIQNSGDATSGDYFLAYAGKPALTPSGTTVAYTEPVPPAVPTLAARNPGVNATGVATTVQPYVRFDRVVTGVSTSTFLLKRTGSGSLAGTVTSAGDGMQYTFHPSAPLVPLATYTVTLSTAIKSSEGVALAPTTWNFSVGGTLTFKQGTHTGYQFSSTGVMTAVKSYTLGKDSSAYTTKRQSLSNQSGGWFYVRSG